MNWHNVATIAAKDLRIMMTRRAMRLSIVLFPLVIAIGLSLVVRYGGGGSGGIPAALLPRVLNSLTFFFAVVAVILPAAIASYSLVGEKIERSLEPLLATPATDGEILLGKSIAAFVPPIVAIWASSALFMALCDQATRHRLGHVYFPNGTSLMIVGAVAPLAAIMCVVVSVLISARVSDVRAAQQVATLVMLPFMAVYVMSEIGVFSLGGTSLAIMTGALTAVDAAGAFAARATFRREEILTRWS